jgi:hypothetical protein
MGNDAHRNCHYREHQILGADRSRVKDFAKGVENLQSLHALRRLRACHPYRPIHPNFSRLANLNRDIGQMPDFTERPVAADEPQMKLSMLT